MSVELENTGADVAFGIELKLADANTGAGIVPIFWQDNYITLLPGESRILQAAFSKNASNASLDIDGWNIKKA